MGMAQAGPYPSKATVPALSRMAMATKPIIRVLDAPCVLPKTTMDAERLLMNFHNGLITMSSDNPKEK